MEGAGWGWRGGKGALLNCGFFFFKHTIFCNKCFPSYVHTVTLSCVLAVTFIVVWVVVVVVVVGGGGGGGARGRERGAVEGGRGTGVDSEIFFTVFIF